MATIESPVIKVRKDLFEWWKRMSDRRTRLEIMNLEKEVQELRRSDRSQKEELIKNMTEMRELLETHRQIMAGVERLKAEVSQIRRENSELRLILEKSGRRLGVQ